MLRFVLWVWSTKVVSVDGVSGSHRRRTFLRTALSEAVKHAEREILKMRVRLVLSTTKVGRVSVNLDSFLKWSRTFIIVWVFESVIFSLHQHDLHSLASTAAQTVFLARLDGERTTGTGASDMADIPPPAPDDDDDV